MEDTSDSFVSAKMILIAHRQPAVRDRFAAALADARHAFVTATSEVATRQALASAATPVSLALVDLGLSENGVGFVRALRQAAGRALPVVVFAGSVEAAGQIPELLALGVAGFVNEHAATAQILPALAPHLFPDSFNRRTSPRVTLRVPVSFRSGQTIAAAFTLNLGKGGLAIHTLSPLEPNTNIHVRFRLPGGADIEASGRVAWSDRKVGMGIRFERVEPRDQSSIDAFVDEQR